MAEETEQQEDVSDLRKAAEAGKAARQEADLAKKELAFVKAGINTDTKPAQALLRSYDGELSTDAIQAEAREWSLLDTPAPEAEKIDYSAEAEAQATRDQLNDGAAAPDTKPQVSLVEQAFKEFHTDREGGKSQTEATNQVIGKIIKAAAMGDPQARFDPDEWEKTRAQFGHGAEYAV
jgi:hypothetical protein